MLPIPSSSPPWMIPKRAPLLLPDAGHGEGGGGLQLQPAGGEDHLLQAVGEQRAGRGR